MKPKPGHRVRSGPGRRRSADEAGDTKEERMARLRNPEEIVVEEDQPWDDDE